jgi:hypothetical protein
LNIDISGETIEKFRSVPFSIFRLWRYLLVEYYLGMVVAEQLQRGDKSSFAYPISEDCSSQITIVSF